MLKSKMYPRLPLMKRAGWGRLLTLSFGQLLLVSLVFGQADGDDRKSYLGFGPLIGFDGARSSGVYGAILEYEYKALARLGFTLAATYDFTPERGYRFWSPDADAALSMGAPDFLMKQHYVSATAGARFYMKRFYVAAAAGYGYNAIDVSFPEFNITGSGSDNRFYYQMSGGYLLPLENGRQLEFGIFTSSGGSPKARGLPKLAATVKYRFAF